MLLCQDFSALTDLPPKKLKDPTPHPETVPEGQPALGSEASRKQKCKAPDVPRASEEDDDQPRKKGKASAVAKQSRKKPPVPRKGKVTVARRGKQNLSGAFRRSRLTVTGGECIALTNDVQDVEAEVLQVNDSTTASLLLNCAKAAPAEPARDSSTSVEILPTEQESIHPMDATLLSTQLPVAEVEIVQPNLVPSSSGDLQVPSVPVGAVGMSAAIRDDTMADLNPFSLDSNPPTKAKTNVQVSALIDKFSIL